MLSRQPCPRTQPWLGLATAFQHPPRPGWAPFCSGLALPLHSPRSPQGLWWWSQAASQELCPGLCSAQQAPGSVLEGISHGWLLMHPLRGHLPAHGITAPEADRGREAETGPGPAGSDPTRCGEQEEAGPSAPPQPLGKLLCHLPSVPGVPGLGAQLLPQGSCPSR